MGCEHHFILLGLFMTLKVNELNATCPYHHQLTTLPQVPRTDQEEVNYKFK